MLFSSLTFLLVFLPVLLLLYFTVKNIKLKNIILLVFSLIFYAWGEPIYIALMLISIFVTYIFGLLIDKYSKNKFKKKLFLIISIVLLLLSLMFFKYGNFIISNLNLIFRTNIKEIDLSLPIGISFYTFQAISYIVDVYNKKTKVQKNILYLALYVTLFPQLIAGPIVRYETIEKEIKNRKHSFKQVELGLKRFILGLSKKVIFANSMAAIVDVIFESNSVPGTILIWIGAICYTLQIYFDFSGYSDMAIGLGNVFGFKFLENFNYPYISKTITEFWRRWHISLSSWFRDYIYIPLGGSRTTILKQIRNICIVWLLTGLWHGASWNFIIWGAYYGLLLLIEKFLLRNILNKIHPSIKYCFTMILIIIGWIIFRITDLNQLLRIFLNLIVFKQSHVIEFILNNADLIFNFYLIIPAIIFCFPIKSIFSKLNIKGYRYIINFIYFGIYIVDIALLVSNTYNPFIYFRF